MLNDNEGLPEVSHQKKMEVLRSALLACFILNGIAADGEKSKKMCEKYAETVYQTEDSPVLTPGAKKSKVSSCTIAEIPLVIGGTKSGSKEFPHMAVIGYAKPGGGTAWLCGASLISEEWVLTASHCEKSKEWGPARRVRLGDLNLADKDDDAKPQEFAIKEFIIHPEYKLPARYNDIALVKLDRKVIFDPYVRPACLQVDPHIKDKSGIAIGYGYTKYGEESPSNDLLKVTLNFIPQEECSKYFKAYEGMKHIPQGLSEGMLCAGVLEGGKDTCQGDSGGPLQVVLEKPYCMYSIVGVTSFGNFCGFKDSPAIYTKVSAYIPWIESVVWP